MFWTNSVLCANEVHKVAFVSIVYIYVDKRITKKLLVWTKYITKRWHFLKECFEQKDIKARFFQKTYSPRSKVRLSAF